MDKRRVFLVFLIPLAAGIVLYINHTPKFETTIQYQNQSSVIYDLYEAHTYSISLTSLRDKLFAGGLWFMHNSKLNLVTLALYPSNTEGVLTAEVKYLIDPQAKPIQVENLQALTTLSINASLNQPGQQLVLSVYPYDSHLVSNEYREYTTIAIGYMDWDTNNNKIMPWVYLGVFTFQRNQNNLVEWFPVNFFTGYDSYLNSEGYWLEFDPDRFTGFLRRIYQVPKTIYSGHLFSNALPLPIAFDNIIAYDTQSSSYKAYTVVDTWYELYTPISTGGMQYIIKYIDNTGTPRNDTLGQKIPILYLYSPLVNIQYKHLDLLMLKLLEGGKVQFILSGVFFYDPQDPEAQIDNRVRVLYDIPGLSPGATCYVSSQNAILPSTINPYNAKVYYLTKQVELVHWVDENTGESKYALKYPIRIGIYDESDRKFVILRINNVTLVVRDNIQTSDLCHYSVESIDYELEKVYDLSTIIPNNNAASITMFDIDSPRAKFYGPMFFRIGLYDSVTSYNPSKIVVYRYDGSAWQRYIIEDKIQPLGTFYREKVLPERVIHTTLGSSVLPFAQTDYDGRTVSKAQFSYYIIVPLQNITYTPKMFTHEINYTYAVTPIDITYIKYYDYEPDQLNNVLVKIEITDPNVLSNIATADARDIRFFEDNTRSGDYWKDIGLTYGIEEYIPNQKLVVYVLIPSLYANQTKTIYMYSGFPYAQSVAASVDTLLAQYPVLINQS